MKFQTSYIMNHNPTYIGGSGDDEGYGIAVDGSGNAYVMGYTTSTNYDVTAGAFQTTNGGYSDVFVTKLNMLATALEDYANVELLLFSIYPNPSYGTFTLQSEEGGVFELMDITGKVLNTYFMQNSNRIDISVDVPAGMYFIRERESNKVQKVTITK